ncbi:hypothetical protein T492DRAFT_1077354, partial [Pavlovales sp. CCMP2436]
IVWIYCDAGWGKALDPEQAWALSSNMPALDTMMLHTPVGRLLRSMLRPVDGVRFLTAFVVFAECWIPPLALFCVLAGAQRLQAACALAMALMHLGIALTMNNAQLLSLVAAVAWAVFIPSSVWDSVRGGAATTNNFSDSKKPAKPQPSKATAPPAKAQGRPGSGALLLPLVCVIVAFNIRQSECDIRDQASVGAGLARISSALLHNRWNVFTTGESHVTWYIAPARLADDSVVDLWAWGAPVRWDVPALAPRAGRWKSFAAVAFAAPDRPSAHSPPTWLEPKKRGDAAVGGDDAAAAPPAQGSVNLWRYLCAEWNGAHAPKQRVRFFKFFLLSADIDLPRLRNATLDLAYGPPRKRLLATYECED